VVRPSSKLAEDPWTEVQAERGHFVAFAVPPNEKAERGLTFTAAPAVQRIECKQWDEQPPAPASNARTCSKGMLTRLFKLILRIGGMTSSGSPTPAGSSKKRAISRSCAGPALMIATSIRISRAGALPLFIAVIANSMVACRSSMMQREGVKSSSRAGRKRAETIPGCEAGAAGG
jgi:hypothetical protein